MISMATTVDDLPNEVLSYILKFLPGSSLAATAVVCRKFHDAVRVDSVWQKRCAEVLHKYGQMQGLWQPYLGAYGGLLHVKFVRNRLVGTNYYAPVNPHITSPLRSRQLFCVCLDDDKEVEVQCLKGTPHSCEIDITVRDQEDNERLQYKCTHRDLHRHPEGQQQELAEWWMWETNEQISSMMDVVGHELLIMKFLTGIHYESNFICDRINIPSHQENVLIQPGMFKGQYGGHGIEIVMLTYQAHDGKATAFKITGDPNVPAGKVSFVVDLNRPIIVTRDQQETVSMLEEIDTPDVPPDTDMNKLPLQDFRVPRDCMNRADAAPRHCKARFHTNAQVARHGFHQPSFIPGHWILFDEDTFGHMWLEIRTFSMFSRIKEDFT